MTFTERPASQRWEMLAYQGKPLAEVWFKPEGGPSALLFRIPQSSFQIPGLQQHLTAENFLKAVGIAATEVESWHGRRASLLPENEPLEGLSQSLLPPPGEDPYLQLEIRIKPIVPMGSTATVLDRAENTIKHPESGWQELQGRWNKILGLEVCIDTLRISLEGLRAEMEAAASKTLTGDDKIYASNTDVAQWTKAKSRTRFALPKVKEFIHRATWAAGAPERKRLVDLFKNPTPPPLPAEQLSQIAEELEGLFKHRQVLNAQGVTVYQDCKAITAEVQSSLRTLQRNAATKSVKSRAASIRGKGR
jgi:hypothetical protein